MIVKTIAKLPQADGSSGIAHLWWLENHGSLACQLLGYFINGEMVKACFDEGNVSYNAKKLAILACDLAEAMYAEMDTRDWILKLTMPESETVSCEKPVSGDTVKDS